MSQNLIQFVPDIISEIEDIQVIFEIQSSKLTELEVSIKDIRDQFFIDTATWGLVFWERRYGIRYDSTLSYEERRQHIYSKRRARGTITNSKLKSICYPYADEVDIVEHSEDDYFEINLKSYSGFKKSIVNLEEVIEDIKPAHLGVNYNLTAQDSTKIGLGICSISGEKITTYPWTPTIIKSEVSVYIPITHYKESEKIITYPKEG